MGTASSIDSLVNKTGDGGAIVSTKIGLTAHDTRIVVETWNAVKDKKALGEAIFRELFVVYPHIKKSFKFKDIPINELVKLPRFREHAANFTAFITVVVEAFPDEAKILYLSQAIGTKHAAMAQFDSSLFDPSYWISFAFIATNMISKAVGVGTHKHPTIQKTWQALLFRLVIEMQARFYKDLIGYRGAVVIPKSGPSAEEMLREAKRDTLKADR